MRKNPKNEPTNGAVAASAAESPQPEVAPASRKKTATAARKTSGKAASKKATRTKPAAKNAPQKRTRAAKPQGPSDADIRLRAYFIAERRVQLALRGDPANDWLEARQQLLQEAGLTQS